MAEKACSRDHPPPPSPTTTIPRRPSFRNTLRDSEATLPDKLLTKLEEKRKQLDDSIHKYIASKEREYKLYEKDVRLQARTQGPTSPTQEARQDANGAASSSRRRMSSESTQSTTGSPRLVGQKSSAVDALLATGARRDSQSQAVNGTDGRRPSEERDKDFVGLFTPAFLPAIDDKAQRQHERTASAPGAVEPSSRESAAVVGKGPLRKADSDSAIQAKAKRPAHLQEGRRTSSSGSSADGKLLTSAMKSPILGTAALKQKKKRVSLAVGDSIVAPSDNVPLTLSNSSTPSHSRSRSPANDTDPAADAPPTSVADFATRHPEMHPTSVADFARQPRMYPVSRGESGTNSLLSIVAEQNKDVPTAGRAPAVPGLASSLGSSERSPSKIDPDGDLFDLEEDSDPPLPQIDDEDLNGAIETEDDIIAGSAARLDPGRPEPGDKLRPEHGSRSEDLYNYDATAGVVPELASRPPLVDKENNDDDDDDHAIHVEFGPGASASSQQPTEPGFRRPSVIRDPVFRGTDYQEAETKAANEEIYGSSYSRPATKGSFTASSLGESYMARHAEEMIRRRVAKQQQDVR
ncbi:hypothetical protein B0A50_03225 [Salinomyces thailandicus]|uniref:Uncharacterized protein n=1 Tax=Salinomyces thailandicus TaxID=706561 RepID=A0A4U0U439_9PEZI|nr:hypothetical protein B0A50_03225 [Salinomyces thailandica]